MVILDKQDILYLTRVIKKKNFSHLFFQRTTNSWHLAAFRRMIVNFDGKALPSLFHPGQLPCFLIQCSISLDYPNVRHRISSIPICLSLCVQKDKYLHYGYQNKDKIGSRLFSHFNTQNKNLDGAVRHHKNSLWKLVS